MTNESLCQLLDSLSFEEKIGQLCQGSADMFGAQGIATGVNDNKYVTADFIYNLGSVLNIRESKMIRLIQQEHLKHSKIPLIFMADILHGYKTIFPISLGLGCCFNPALVKKSAEISAKEMEGSGIDATFSPMVDITEDARWGRCSEGYGEDTLLTSLYSKAMVEGYQGDDLSRNDTVAACVKHFAAYGATYDGKDYNSVEMSERRLRQKYLPAYKAACDAGAALLMSSFNTINSIPATLDPKLMVEILRNEWGYNGTVISDYGSMIGAVNEGAVESIRQAAKLFMDAKVDIDMMDEVYYLGLIEAYEHGNVDISVIDEAVMRVLKLKNSLGLFENPYKSIECDDKCVNYDIDKHFDTAKEIIYQSSVLLKNDNSILPLKKSSSIAFVGPFVNQNDLCSLWSELSPARLSGTSIKEELKKRFGNRFRCEPGCPILRKSDFPDEIKDNEVYGKEDEYLARAVDAAKNAEYVVIPIGEHKMQFGESRSRSSITIPNIQMELFNAIYEVNKKIIVVLFNGRPLDISELSEKAAAVLDVWYPGTMGAQAIVNMIFGDAVPSGKLSMSFPRISGQCPIHYDFLPTSHFDNTFTSNNIYKMRYIDIPSTPLFAFGHGLSYTRFSYSGLSTDKSKTSENETIAVSVNVTNEGEIGAFETVQLYIHDVSATLVSRPLKELKAFKKVFIKPHETIRVELQIDVEMLKYYDYNMNYIAEKGKFEAFVGTSSDCCDVISFELI